MNCIIVDDEPSAIEILENYIERIDFLNLNAKFSDPVKALHYLMLHTNIDLVFLDINMPQLSGIDILNSLSHQPSIIFTTAYSEYALESFDYNTIDYLVKPISFPRFLKAVNKKYNFESNKTTSQLNSYDSFIYVKSSQQVFKIQLSDILFIEGAGNYWSFQLENKKILSLNNYAEISKLLPKDRFIRVHKSYIIPKDKITILEKHQITIGKYRIPVGLTYREVINTIFKEI